MENVHLKAASVDRAPFVNERKKCMKYTVINLSCNNSIKSCDVLFVVNSSRTQLDTNVRTASSRVIRNAIRKLLRNVSAKLMLKR